MSLRGAIVREYFGRIAFGRIFGILMGIAAVGGVIGPSAAGWTFDQLGNYQPVWLFYTGMSFIAALLALQLKGPIQHKEKA